VRIYRSDDGIVGVSIRDKGQGHFALLSSSQAYTLASMLESGWRKRNAYSSDAITGAVDGLDGRAIVAVMTNYPPNRVSLAVNDSDTGIAASFWSNVGAIRYLAATLRRAAR